MVNRGARHSNFRTGDFRTGDFRICDFRICDFRQPTIGAAKASGVPAALSRSSVAFSPIVSGQMISRVARHAIVVGVPYRQDLRVGRTTCAACRGTNPPWGHVNSFDENRLKQHFGKWEPVATSFEMSAAKWASLLSIACKEPFPQIRKWSCRSSFREHANASGHARSLGPTTHQKSLRH